MTRCCDTVTLRDAPFGYPRMRARANPPPPPHFCHTASIYVSVSHSVTVSLVFRRVR
jgi:hypothetical protein